MDFRFQAWCHVAVDTRVEGPAEAFTSILITFALRSMVSVLRITQGMVNGVEHTLAMFAGVVYVLDPLAVRFMPHPSL
jgi:hypothetical protein